MKDDIYALHLKIKNRQMSVTELTQSALKNVKNNDINSFISLTEDLALNEAKKQDQLIEKEGVAHALQGIPYTLKDLFITKGIRTTAGSKILYNYIPPYDGHVSSQLKKAGGILIGKVGCDEFGMGSTNESTPFGSVKNPLNKERVAGGSSGGSAAAVAAGQCFYSMGTDTGGSSRLPANFCGLVGFKPSYGRISRYGQIAYASSLDQAAPIAQSVLDMACILDSVTERDLRDSTNAPNSSIKILDELLKINPSYIKGKKIGISQDFINACDPDVAVALKNALDVFTSLGAKIVDLNLDNLKYCVSAYYVIATCEASSNLSRYDGIRYGLRKAHKGSIEDTYIESRSFGFGEEVKKRIMLGTFSLSSGYYDAYYKKACQVRRLIADDYSKAFNECDVIFSPVCASTAFKLESSLQDPLKMYMNDLYTIPVNLAGLPGLALPYGKGADKMPTGFQLVTPAFKDEELLKIGRAFELATQGN